MSEPRPILTDAAELRARMNRKAVSAIQQVLPLTMRHGTLEVHDVRAHDREYSPREQYDALMRGRTLQVPVKGTLVYKDLSGKVLDTAKDFTLVHLPYLTERHTLIAGGNEYQVANQLRRKPGVYTARADNGELRAVFNLSKGKNFDVGFEPERGTFSLQYGTSNIPLYPVLRALGVSHETMTEHLGKGVADANAAAHGKEVEKATGKLYAKLIHPSVMDPKAEHGVKVEEIKKKLAQTAMDPHVTETTLGARFEKVTPEALLTAARKVLDVHAGRHTTDDTDALTFKTFHALDDFLGERIKLLARQWAPKASRALLLKPKIHDALRPGPFTDGVRSFVTTSSLAAVPTGINPLELIDHAVKVTSLGEGGIPSDRAIPLDARMIHNTHFGALDPIRTPECFVPETEVLTYAGWKRWDAVTETDAFACNVAGRLEYHRATRLIREPYAGLLYGVRKGKLAYLVTPNHRVYCAPVDRVYPLRSEDPPSFDFVRADEVHNKPRVFDTAHAPYLGEAATTFDLPPVPGYPRNVSRLDLDDWAAFMGWYLAEGCISAWRKAGGYAVNISQSATANPEKCTRIAALLGRLPFKWRRTDAGFYINHRQLAAYLQDFGFCQDKYIPEYLQRAPVSARVALLEALLLGDGRIDSRRATGKTYKQRVFCTTSAQLARDVERLAVGLGMPAHCRVYADRRQERYLDVYEVRLLQNRYRQAVPRKKHHYTEYYTGLVYCATVPGGLLYVRHGGGVAHWSGNSSHSGVDIRATIAAHRDDSGNLYTVMRNIRTGKEEFVKAGDLAKHVVAFPGQALKGDVDAFVNGEIARVAASRVTHQLPHTSHIYSPATSLIPMIHGIQGNRAIMGSKMGTQALPLVEREAPFVQVKSHLPGEVSNETLYGHMVVPRTPVSGKVVKIEDGWIYIRPHGAEKKAEAAFELYAVSEKIADRPVVAERELGPFTFSIEIEKGDKPFGHAFHHDYGYLEGYTGPDGDSLDFWVGEDPGGTFVCVDTEEKKGGAWRKADTKYIVGVAPEGIAEVLAQIEQKPDTRCVNRRDYDSWAALEKSLAPFKNKQAKTAAKDSGLIRVPYSENFPFPSKTYLHHDLSVKPGDEVRAGQRLGDSNYTRKGTLALGKNLLVAYVPYHGLNSNDAVVISEGCAKKLTSEHMYREVFTIPSGAELSLEKHRHYYGPKYSPSQYASLDAHGVVKKGSTVHPKDLLVCALVKTAVVGTDALLGRISKALSRPYQEAVLSWSHGTPGTVVDVVRTSTTITILVKTLEQMQVGDKLAGRYGNKGVVAKILPDHEMLRDAKDRPIDLLLTSAGVISRTNPAQVLETSLGKVVEKTGKPILVDNNAAQNLEAWTTKVLKDHGVQDKEHIYDPVYKRTIRGPDGKGVLVGRQFIYKLFKSTSTNFAGHGVGPYDLNEQPLKTGGDDSAKGIGKMEFDALVSHNARNFLREAATIKGQKNDEFWKALQLGTPMPAAKPTFAFRKFVGMLEGAGLKVDQRGSKFKLLPLTDRDVIARSAGAVEHGKTLIAKNLRPEPGGLFDPRLTGGPQGTLYSHIDLHEPIPHPVFKEPVRRLLGLTEKTFDAHLAEHGGTWFRDRLKEIDVPDRIKTLRAKMVSAKGAELNDIVKQIKYLEALQKEGYKPHEAYVVSKVPVVPPVFRPIIPQPNDPGQLMVADANKLYAHVLDSDHTLKTTAVESDRGKHRAQVFNAVAALYGTEDVANDELKGQAVKGFLSNIAGVGTPKGGFFQRKLMRRTQDVSGRGTAVPDASLGMDHVGIPEQMLWQMYEKLITARLIRQGYSALDAKERVLKKDAVARAALHEETTSRPVFINRAPTLHRWSFIAAYPVPVQGKTIRVNPFIEKGMNLDYDGDTLQVHAPITHDAIEEAKKLTLSNLLMADHTKRRIMAYPQHEAIIGLTHAAKLKSSGKPVRKFKSLAEAEAAWKRGELDLQDPIEIG